MPLSASTHAAIGAFSGIIEVTLLHPTVAWKNALQEGRPLSLAPSALYRGYLMNVGSFAPITMVQFGVNRLLEARLSETGDGAAACRALRSAGQTLRRRRAGSGLSGAQRIAVAATAGVSSSFISTSCELIIIQQQVRAGCEPQHVKSAHRSLAAHLPTAGVHSGRPH